MVYEIPIVLKLSSLAEVELVLQHAKTNSSFCDYITDYITIFTNLTNIAGI